MTDERAHYPQKPTADGMLEVLVAVVNNTKSEMSMTLSIPGGVITGLLIGYREWLSRIEARIARDSPNAAGMFDAWAEQDDETQWGDELEDSDVPRTMPNFVHLADANYVEWSGLIPNEDSEGLMWRGRLSEVSGWSLGSFKRFESP